MSKIERDVKFLKIYSLIITGLLLGTFLFGFTNDSKPKFREIDVERINVIEPNGDLKMVISNSNRQHPGILNGKVIPRKGPRGPGIIFFNYKGDETGGIGADGDDKWGHSGGLAFDKLNHDQTLALRHTEDKSGDHEIGLHIWQRPKNTVWESIEVDKKIKEIKDPIKREEAYKQARKDGLIHAKRLFLGKRKNNSVELVLSDQLARPRIRLIVNQNGSPVMEFMDESGRVTNTFPSSP